jgi:E1A/CREB-binding protein
MQGNAGGANQPHHQPPQQPQQQGQRQMMININQIQPLVSGQPVAAPAPQPAPPQNAQSSTRPAAAVSGTGAGSGSVANPTQSEDHRMQVLKQQQQRLLLLRHASKCPYENGRCRITPLCASMKQLWKHIMSCKDQECKMSHCVSSRYVLSHYSKCKDQNCPVCGPVRKAIKDNYEKSRNIIESAKDPRVSKLPEDPTKKPKDLQVAPPRPKQMPLDPVSCAIYCFSNEQIQSHIKNIHEGVRITAAKVKELFMPILDEILRLPNCLSIFGSPVDPVLFNLPDYFTIIKSPMDLGSVRKKLEALQYRDSSFFVEDVHLTFDNAMLYNPKSSQIHQLAKSFKKDFDNKYKNATAKYESTLEANRLDENACVICGETKLNFEPPVYYCNGRCGGQRIRRNAFFYSAANNTYHWCSNCFQDLKDSQPIRLPDLTITKAELRESKKKHQEEAQESWVQCDSCTRWVHTICGLFNSRRNFGDDVSYMCANCLVDKRKTGGDHIIGAVSCKTKASDLPRCNMSDFLEARLLERLETAYTETAAKLGIPRANVEKCPPLVLRQVSCIDKMQLVREGVHERYSHKNYPMEFPCRVKCVTLFQNIDGQDVILFGMYVYEYGHKCPQPNQRRVYVSYLDSVHYLRPKRYRTIIYHEILVSYLEYVKRRGFHTAHIWSCPPSKGDDYILYCHPVDQKTPKTDKLQKWYADMLDECIARGIACELTDLHTECLVDPTLDATVLPYFEGDYWTTEAEVIISALKEESAAGNGSASGAADEDEFEEESLDVGVKSKRKVKSKTKASRSTRSKPTATSKSERDPVMAKLANIIEPMKNTFFLARLYPKEYADRFAASRQAEIISEEADNNPEKDSKRIEQQLQDDISVPSMPVTLTKVPSPTPTVEVTVETSNPHNGEGPGGNDDFDQMAQTVTNQQECKEEFESGDDNKSDRGDNTPVSMTIETSGSNVETAVRAMSVVGSTSMEMDSSPSPVPMGAPGNDLEMAESKEEMNAAEEAEMKEDDGSGRRAAKRARTEDEAESQPPTAVVKIEVDNQSRSQTPAQGTDSLSGAAASTAAGSSASTASNLRAATPGVAVKSEAEPPSNQFLQCLRDDTEDIDEVQESEHWDTRQAFLNLCQGNHYQFDQLRRAKHTSMMVLYLMHNPDAPKFLPNCNVCHKDILVGGRYRCETCDMEFCADCYSQQGNRIHAHPLRHISGSGSSSSEHKLTEQERRDRQRNLLLHVELLVHATDCADPSTCTVKNCAKMKVRCFRWRLFLFLFGYMSIYRILLPMCEAAHKRTKVVRFASV